MGDLVYYVDGKYVSATEAALPLGDLAIVRGFGVFDFLRTYGHKTFMLRDHVSRLKRSAQQIGLDFPWTLVEIESIVQETNDRNGVGDVGIRIVVTGGLSSNFMLPEGKSALFVMIDPVSPYPAQIYTDGASVITTGMGRIMPTVKSLNYMGAIMAVRDAGKVGAVEAIYRTSDGYVTEGTRSNLFIVQDGKLITPKKDILLGITRKAVLEVALGEYDVVETQIPYEDLLAADEVFITGTTKEIMPILRVDETTIGNGRAGESTRDIAQRFHELVLQRTAGVAVD